MQFPSPPPTESYMREIDLAYAAGLLDGEGSVCLIRPRKSAPYRYPFIYMTNTSIELVSLMYGLFGGRVRTKKVYRKHYKPAYEWMVSGNTCIEALKLMLPYMRDIHKIDRALLIVKHYKTVTSRNGKYSNEAIEAKQNFETRFASI